jgi:FkbM family methyltransferase
MTETSCSGIEKKDSEALRKSDRGGKEAGCELSYDLRLMAPETSAGPGGGAGPSTGGIAVRALRAITAAVPVKGWMLVTERLHPMLSGGRRELLFRAPDGLVLRLDLEDYVQRGVLYGAYEATELQFARRVLRPGDVMFDVGAHVGTFSLLAAGAVGPSGQVHAFEPLPSNFARLQENRDLNRFRQVVLNRAAVGAEEGSVSLGLDRHISKDSPAWQAGYAVGLAGDSVEAPQVTLDGYSEGHLEGRVIRLLKMDVEGREPEVLAGMALLLEGRRVEILMMEVNLYALARFGHRIADSIAPLEAAGYRPFSLRMGGRLRPWRYAGEPALLPARRGILPTLATAVADRTRNFNLVWLAPGSEAAG